MATLSVTRTLHGAQRLVRARSPVQTGACQDHGNTPGALGVRTDRARLATEERRR